MKKFDNRVKVGTWVMVNSKWYIVKEIHATRQWIKVEGLVGSFQTGHVEKFSNKKVFRPC